MSIEVALYKELRGFILDMSFKTSGQCTGILGASGCGKSMTLKGIAGLEKLDRGEVRLGERTLFNKEKRINLPPQERKVGYLFQNYALFPHMTVEENISIGIKGTKEEIKEKMNEQIERFQLKGLRSHYPSQLSGGQQQRVALARVLAYEPELLLLDEPFSALDSFLKDDLAKQLLEVLRDFKGNMIMVSHSRDELYTFCEQLIVMKNGSVLIEGATKEIFSQPKKMEVARLTGCKNISPIRRLGKHQLLAIDWNLTLTTKEEIKASTKYVGIRAHDIKLTHQGKDNQFNMEIRSYLEFPFQIEYLVQEKRNTRAQPLCCEFPKAQMLHLKEINIFIPPEALILLE